MSLSMLLRILRARWLWLAGVTLLCAGAAAALVVNTPRQYTAEATLLVNFAGREGAPGDGYPASLFSDYVATQMNLIGSHAVGIKAVRALGLGERPAVMERVERSLDGPAARIHAWAARAAVRLWRADTAESSAAQRARDLADALRRRLTVANRDSSGMLELRFSSADPWVSQRVVNAFARAYLRTSGDLNAQPAREDAKWFDSQIKGLSDDLQAAQAALSRFQQQHRIVATDERVDTENAKLQELSSQLTAAQTKAYGLRAEQQQVHDYLAGGTDLGLMPDVLSDRVVEHLKEAISEQKRKLSEVAAHVGRNHPDYIGTEAELKALQERLADEITGIAASIDASVRAAGERQRSLEQAVADQKQRVLSLRHDRDRLDLLKTRVDNAQRVYDAALQRMSQARMQGNSTRSSVSLVSLAVAPRRPSGPHAVQYLAGGLLAGITLGIAAALWREVRDRRVRSRDDIAEVLGVPVFATVTPKTVRRAPRRGPPPRIAPRLTSDDG